jgi:hypothetical protein
VAPHRGSTYRERCRNTSATRPASTITPSFITYLIGIASHDHRSWVISAIAVPSEPREQLQDLRLDGDVRAVVGSSAISRQIGGDAIAIMTR